MSLEHSMALTLSDQNFTWNCWNYEFSFIPLACAEFDSSLPFSGASSIPLCYVLFPAMELLKLWIFIHSVACRMQHFLAVLRSFFHSSLLCIFSCHGIVEIMNFHSFSDVQNATFPCRSQELLPFLSVTYFFLPWNCWNYEFSFIPVACAECDISLPFSGASSIPLCYVLFPAMELLKLWIFIHSSGMCIMWRFLAVLRSFFHSSLLCTSSCHGIVEIMNFHSFQWHVQNATIPCRSQELLPFLSVMYFFLQWNCWNYEFSFIPVSCAECDISLPFSGASSIPLCYVLFPAMELLKLWIFIHSIGMCRMWWFLAVLRSFFHSSLLYTLSLHPFPPTSLPSSLTSYCLLFLGLPLSFAVSRFIYNTFLWILFSSILCTCPNQRNLFNFTISVIAGFSNTAYISLLVNILQFSFSLSHTGSKILFCIQ